MTFAVLKALHGIIGEALCDIEAVYALHGSQNQPSSGLGMGRDKTPTPDPSGNYSAHYGPPRPSHRPNLSTENSAESLRQPALDFPALDAPCNQGSISEALTQHPGVVAAANRIISACGQMSATVQTPFLTICDAVMGYHLPSCMRLFEASHVPEILREAGPAGLHVNIISKKNGVDKIKLAHILRLLATHHIVRELSPDVFALNRISSTIDTGKDLRDIHQWTTEGIPEKKYQDTSGVAAFVGLCSDEIYKSAAYLTETYLLSQSDVTRAATEPTQAPFCFAFGTAESKTGFFGWLEGSSNSQSTKVDLTADVQVETGHLVTHSPVQGDSERGHFLKATSFGPGAPVNGPNANRFRVERFGKAMSGTCSWEAPGAILNSFDWNSLPRGSVVVDVGGGIGSTSMLLASAFSSHNEHSSNLRFIVQDRPVVVEMGEKAWRAKCPEFLDNGTALFQVHDFFAPQPVKQAAVFLLRVVLHDWPDDFARRILLHLREAATPRTKLLLGDFILPLACPDEVGGNELLEGIQGAEAMLAPPPLLPNLGKANANAYWMDMTMQVVFNAQERTLREIVGLAASAGWKVIRVTKSVGSLFGYIVAIPCTIPPQATLDASDATSYRDPAFARHQSPETSNDPIPVSLHVTRRDKRDEQELIERSSSRCGTPTFGSRMHLSLVEEALSRFGSGILRSRRAGTASRATSSSKSTSLKPPITLTPVPPVKKKSSPLSVPPTLPSPTSPTTKTQSSPKPPGPTLGQRILPRRLSLANLRVTSVQLEQVPPVPTVGEPPSPMSPGPSLTKKASLASLATKAGSYQQGILSNGSARATSPSGSNFRQRKVSNAFGIKFPLPSTTSTAQQEGLDEQPQFRLPGWTNDGKTQISSTFTGRRSSLAQVSVRSASPKTSTSSPSQDSAKAETRKRTKSVAGLSSKAGLHAANAVAFMSEIGASFGHSSDGRVGAGPSRLGGLLNRGSGNGLRLEKSRDAAMPSGLPELSSFAEFNLGDTIGEAACNHEGQASAGADQGSVNILAAAARIEKKVLRRKESP
ncbi:hypothetical protein NP233_g5308 [Leucocoprinus birnbaumii]|uniref:O-methyltransferase C-terminal domain-containing protein n=1 Tax=Leucocoprinus birnbaumii TaxID=56174 RepID=A0AAD5VT46_9AGAR|nr:hypothetical protein NP233_g5308 [Leucocoprinus birnbaumii]